MDVLFENNFTKTSDVWSVITKMDLTSDRFMEFDGGNDDELLIQRIDSNDIIYCPPKRKYKVRKNT